MGVDERGAFVSVTSNAAPGVAERLAGPVLPGMANLHSHAFQRALAGLTEVRGSPEDDFWTWRELMYRFVERLSPALAQAVALQLYIEMLKAGYTAVAEFHYIHNPEEMLERHVDAARQAGIAITLLPSLYRWSGFGSTPLEPRQERFRSDPQQILILASAASVHVSEDVRVGVAPHSLRAVDPAALKELVGSLDPRAPIHIHAAEQTKEVDECKAALGKRPVEWLLENHPINERWCIVHATHMVNAEVEGLAKSGAVAGLCPSTEASLGDGIFSLLEYRGAGGRYGIGGDSHVCRDPAEELRLLEYVQRLSARKRNLVVTKSSPAVGTTLWREAVTGGAQALGRAMGAILPGKRADLVVLDGAHHELEAHSGDAIANAMIFSGSPGLVRDVMVAGEWAVQERHHAREENAARNYRQALRELLA